MSVRVIRATLRCAGGCGSELVTSDPVNHRAAYICPRCREADRQRFIEAVMRCPGCDCDPVGYAPHNGKGDCPPKPGDPS